MWQFFGATLHVQLDELGISSNTKTDAEKA